jgi:hypothetical protein
MPTVWDQFSDPVESPQSWDDISAPATPELSPADQQIMQDRHWKGLTKEKLDQRLALERADPSQYDPSSTEYQERYDQPGVMRTVGSAALRAPVTLADTTVSVGRNVAAAPVAGLAGLITAPLGFVPGMEGVGARNVERVQSAIGGQPFTEGGQQMTDAVGYVPGKIEQATDWAGQKVANATGSPLVGATVKTAINAIPMLAGGGVARARVRGNGDAGPVPPRRAVEARKAEAATPAPAQVGRGSGLERVPEKTPSIDELKAQAKAAYQRASDAGISISPQSLTGLKAKIVAELKREGIDPTLHPSSTAALKRITSTKGELSLDGLETLRKIAKDAEKSTQPADVRLASKIVDQIDDYVERLDVKDVTKGDPAQAAALKEARSLYSRQKKAEEIQHLFERAEISAPNFSGSGMENALRTEFRALAKNDRKMRRFTPEEQAAIKKVAKGGPMENLLRQVGKFAPTGAVSTGISMAGGFMLGGPAGAGAVPAIGAASRYAATRMTKRNARRAEELMRRGPQNALMQKQPVMAE